MMYDYDVEISETETTTIRVEGDSEKKAIKQAKAGKGRVTNKESSKIVRATCVGPSKKG